MLIWFCSWMKNYKIAPVVSLVVLYSCEMWQLAEGDKEGCNSSTNKLNAWKLRMMKEDRCSQYGVAACCVSYTRLETSWRNTWTQSYFLLICPSSDFLKIQHVSVAGSASIFRKRSTYISGPLELFSVTGHHFRCFLACRRKQSRLPKRFL